MRNRVQSVLHSSSDARYFATASQDGSLKVWDSKSGNELRSLRRHAKQRNQGVMPLVAHLRLAASGESIVAVDQEGTAHLAIGASQQDGQISRSPPTRQIGYRPKLIHPER